MLVPTLIFKLLLEYNGAPNSKGNSEHSIWLLFIVTYQATTDRSFTTIGDNSKMFKNRPFPWPCTKPSSTHGLLPASEYRKELPNFLKTLTLTVTWHVKSISRAFQIKNVAVTCKVTIQIGMKDTRNQRWRLGFFERSHPFFSHSFEGSIKRES